MVVFTCNHCGDSLHKPAVEKHYSFVCRTVKSLTCVDCLKDFRAEEYAVHTKCLTEEERYAAKGSFANGLVKKGELKQESWVEMIKSILDQEPNLKFSHRSLLETISSFSNIPRKKPKFLNFIKSSSGGRVNMKEVEDVWNIIEKYKINKASQSSNKPNGQAEKIENPEKIENNSLKRSTSTSNGKENDFEEPRKKKKKKNDNVQHQEKTENLEVEQEPVENEKFNFKLKIMSILESKGTVALKKLEKKVINAYLKHTGEPEVSPKMIKKFSKKLKKIPNININDESVSLKTM